MKEILLPDQKTTQENIPTFRASSRIVIVDVAVKDSTGRHITGLKASDFSLLEDKRLQQIRNFEEKTSAIVGQDAFELRMAPNTFTNVVTAPQSSALNIILIDALNTSQESQPSMRANLKVLADSLPIGSRVAIFGLSNQLVMLQSFTADPAVLKAVLSHPTHSPSAAALQPTGTPEASSDMVLTPSGAYDAASYDPGSALSLFSRTLTKSMMDRRVRLTVDALDQLSRYLAAIPGRKNLIWVSGSFPLTNLLDTGSAQPGAQLFDNAADYEEAIARVSADLSNSRVAVFPVDPGGVATNIAFNAGQLTGAPGFVDNNPSRIQRATSTFESAQIQQRASMDRFADLTGGHAYYGSNDVATMVTKAINFGANYYTLSYIPSNKNWDGKERSIKVQLQGKSYNLAYRTSYIATDNPVTAVTQQTTPEAKRTAESAVAATMQRGAPNPTEILFKLLVTPSQPIEPPALDKARKKELAAVSKQAQRRYRIDYAVNPEDISWTPKNGVREANLEFMIIGYNAQGDILNKSDRTVPLHLTEQNFAAAQRGGIQLSQEIAMPAKGEYYLRIGVLDRSTNRIGGIEVSTVSLQMPKP